MAKKQAKPFEQAYYPDLPNFDMGGIELQQAPSLYDDLSRWLAQAWYGEDPKGMNDARRAVDVSQFAIPPVGIAIGGNEIARAVRQKKSPEETAVTTLLAGAGVVPGGKGIGKVAKEVKVATDLGDAYKKLGKLLSTDKEIPLDHPDLVNLTKFIQDETTAQNAKIKSGTFDTKSELVDQFKTLKAQQATGQQYMTPAQAVDMYKTAKVNKATKQPQTYGELIDQYKAYKANKAADLAQKEKILGKESLFNQEPLIAGKPPIQIQDPYGELDKYFVEDSPAYNDLKNKTGEYSLTDYQLNTNATFNDLQAYFGSESNIPPFENLSEQQLNELDDFVKQSKANTPQVYDDPADQLNYDEHLSYEDEQIPKTSHGSPTGIDTWHVSSHKFDDFNINKVLTGEGTIMEGLGMYTSNNPPGQDYYTRQFTTANTKMFPYDAPKQRATEIIANNMAGGLNTSQSLKSSIKGMETYKGAGSWRKQDDEVLKVLRDWDKNGIPDGAISTPYVYDVNLDVDEKMLPEYRYPIPDQDQKVQKLIRDAYMEHPGITPTGNTDVKSYEDLYNEMFRANMAKRGLKNPSSVAYVRPDNYGLDPHAKETVNDLIEQYGSLEEVSKGLGSGEIQVPPSWMDDINAVLVHMEDTAVPNTPAGIQAKQIVDHFKGDVEGSLNFIHGKGYDKYDPNMADDITKILQGWHNFGVNPGVKSLGTPRDAAMETSSYLYKRGIPGHKYLPGEGAFGDQGTRNFVSYHHEYMKIIKRIKLALAAGISTAVLAQQYGQDNVDAAQSQ